MATFLGGQEEAAHGKKRMETGRRAGGAGVPWECSRNFAKSALSSSFLDGSSSLGMNPGEKQWNNGSKRRGDASDMVSPYSA